MKVSVVSLVLCASSAVAQTCTGVDTHLSPQLRELYTEVIKISLPKRPSKRITLDGYLAQGDWAAVFSHPPESERGAFFIKHQSDKYILVDTWGGVAGPDSMESIASWARRLSPSFPPTLAKCFANEVKYHW
jgi:hypothetical protein